jgi:hypothetical protein
MKMNDGNLPNPGKFPFYWGKGGTSVRTLTEEGAPPKKLKGRKIRNSTKPV